MVNAPEERDGGGRSEGVVSQARDRHPLVRNHVILNHCAWYSEGINT